MPLLYTQSLQGRDHVITAAEFGPSRVCSIFAPTGEGHHDDTCKNTEHNFSNDGHNKVAKAVTPFCLEDHSIDGVPDNAGKKHNEGIHDPLNQRERHHIAVGNVTNFMSEYGLHFIG